MSIAIPSRCLLCPPSEIISRDNYVYNIGMSSRRVDGSNELDRPILDWLQCNYQVQR